MHQANTEECGEADENGVDEEEVERSEEIEQMTSGQSIAGCAEWWHKGCCYGYAWNDIALAFRAYGNDACRTTTQGYEHVVERRRCACEKLRLSLAQWCDEEIERCREHTYESGHAEVLCRAPKQVKVIDAYGESHADDWPHER